MKIPNAKVHWLVLAAILVFFAAPMAFGQEDTGLANDVKATVNAMLRYTRAVPIPDFAFPFERYLVKRMYEARNSAVVTYSYVRSPFTGKVLWSCKSLGFPVPYATQMTGPEGMIYGQGAGWHLLPLPEPNGLYPPSSAMGTWVACVNADGTLSPSYQEPNVETYLTPMKEMQTGSNFVLVPNGAPSLRIENPVKK